MILKIETHAINVKFAKRFVSPLSLRGRVGVGELGVVGFIIKGDSRHAT